MPSFKIYRERKEDVNDKTFDKTSSLRFKTYEDVVKTEGKVKPRIPSAHQFGLLAY